MGSFDKLFGLVLILVGAIIAVYYTAWVISSLVFYFFNIYPYSHLFKSRQENYVFSWIQYGCSDFLH